MAKFGQSFKDILMAEAMLEEEYKSSHELDEGEDLKASFQQEASNEDDKKKAPPSALKPRTGYDSVHENDMKDSTRTDKKSDVRSVVIQVPSKRQRLSGDYSAVDVVHGLNKAMTEEERNEALWNAIQTFDHDNRDRHDHEITVGADIALVKCLVFLEFKSFFRREPIQADMHAITREIGMVLTALEFVYRYV
jgi:hypothetical protein